MNVKLLLFLVFIGIIFVFFFPISSNLNKSDKVVLEEALLPSNDISNMRSFTNERVVVDSNEDVVVEQDDTKTSVYEQNSVDTVVQVEKEVSVVVSTEIFKEQVLETEQPVVSTQLTNEEKPQISFLSANEITRKAIVNIFCTTKSGGTFKPISGSGVLIDKRGVILTNAHVAQYFLLKDYLVDGFVECVVRTGSPAKPQYKATLIYISPSWVRDHSGDIVAQSPLGTGEDDYALLLITGMTDPQKTLPDTFSFVPLFYQSENLVEGDLVLLAAYPAGFLGGISIVKDLYISSTVTNIMEVFTFKEGTLDIFSIGGSVVAQQGSSGGAVMNADSQLLGVIVTSSITDTTENRDLRAITIEHINRSFTRDTGFSLQDLFASDIILMAENFNQNVSPLLKQLLVDELRK